MPPNWSKLSKTYEQQIVEGDLASGYANLKKAYEDGGSDNADVLWRYSRACYEMADASSDRSVREPLLKHGLALAQQAVEMDPHSYGPHKYAGILLSSQYTSSPKERVANAYVIRDHFQKAAELNPADSAVQHCLGNWCWNVMQVTWWERQAAKVLFGDPPKCTYDECLSRLHRSSELRETDYNAKLLGDVYCAKKEFDEAQRWYRTAVGLTKTTDTAQLTELQEKMRKCRR